MASNAYELPTPSFVLLRVVVVGNLLGEELSVTVSTKLNILDNYGYTEYQFLICNYIFH